MGCFIFFPRLVDTYLLLAEFSVRTVNYGPTFFHRFMAQALRAWARNRWKKRGSVIYRTDRNNEANEMFIAAGHQPAADYILERFESFLSMV